MKISVILGHPHEGSFNHAIIHTVISTLNGNGHEVFFHDLYKENFNPILPYQEVYKDVYLPSQISMYCEELTNSDGIIIVHPNWWGQPPAILKGWVDRVIRAGVAYEFVEGDSGEGVPVGLLKLEKVLVFNTSNTPHERELTVLGDPLERLWKDCIFGFCGVRNFYRKTFGVIVTSTKEKRQSWLEDVRITVSQHFPKIK